MCFFYYDIWTWAQRSWRCLRCCGERGSYLVPGRISTASPALASQNFLPQSPLRNSFSWLMGIKMPGGLGGLPSKRGHGEESLQDACLCCHREQPAGHPSSHKASSCPRRCPRPSLPVSFCVWLRHQHTPPQWLICHC